MTGIERLRRVEATFEKLSSLVHYDGEPLCDVLHSIASQIERERDEAYDIVLPEIREAIAWVRGHGGLDAVKAHWSGRVPLSSVKRMVEWHKKRRDRLKAHALVLEHKCRERRERIKELNRELDELDDICGGESVKDTLEEALNLCATIGCEPSSAVGEELVWALGECTDIVSRRLMPEGMEWPKFEDGEPVRLGDAFSYGDETFYVDSVQLLRREFHLWATNGKVVTGSNGERCERPVPKVLDADGVEIRVGDTVWNETGLSFKVTSTNPKNNSFEAIRNLDGSKCYLNPRAFTHERPDSFELIEQDVELCPHDYAQKYNKPSGMSNAKFQRTDLVRRAKALAERGQ